MVCGIEFVAATPFSITPCHFNKEVTLSIFCLFFPVLTALLVVTTTTPSPGVSHARRCNDSEKTYCVNGGDCYFIHGINQLSCK